jgi:HD-like signal output (HDOD) protein/AmiR/NasT family two-component response regulator
MAKRVLFVDDEPMVLAGLQRSLRSMRDHWEMVFVNSGAEALKAMDQQPFEIVVTDMRMPVMTGAQLLDEVKRRFPQCFRIILSGQADQETIMRAVDPTHQYLAKPCDTNELKRRLTRAFAVRGLLKNPELEAVISRLQALPSLPSLYLEVTRELENRDPSISRIARVVAEDMAMTAKILQLVNSAFFGIRSQVSSPIRAVQLLGLDTLRALVLSTHVFDKFRTSCLREPEVAYLWKDSFVVASLARRVAESEQQNRRMVDDCFTAGLLHDSGKLILASTMEEKYQIALQIARQHQKGLVDAEREVFGCTHAEVAAFLLGLWDLPENVVEGVAWHHDPSENLQPGFSTALATHVATALHEEQSPFWMQDGTVLNTQFLIQNGYAGREEVWRKLIEKPVGPAERPQDV